MTNKETRIMRERDVFQFTFVCDRFSKKEIDINEAKLSKSLIPFSHKAKTLLKLLFKHGLKLVSLHKLLRLIFFDS